MIDVGLEQLLWKHGTIAIERERPVERERWYRVWDRISWRRVEMGGDCRIHAETTTQPLKNES
jgi:hypothetical protein